MRGPKWLLWCCELFALSSSVSKDDISPDIWRNLKNMKSFEWKELMSNVCDSPVYRNCCQCAHGGND